MLKQILLTIETMIFCCTIGCTQKAQDLRETKNDCYANILKELREQPIYKEVISQFEDTFKVMKNDTRYFGAPPGFDNKVDESVFFNKKKTACMLIVLQKNTYDLIFGSARMVRGSLQSGKWIFKVSSEYFFEKNYFDLYPENSFENISKLARSSVLIDGDVKKKGCEIDEDYWFVKLQQ